jgi:3-hydroxyacyl-CoA dehydrogenase/enoyl-CoA hydratase/3-hydroxybutyryl-CoA epimerase
MSQGFKIIPQGEIAVLEWDLPGEKVNKLSSPVMMALDKILDDLKASSYKAVVIISRKSKIFVAGADINEIVNIREKKDAFEKAASGQRILSKFEDLPMPVIAAINGACLGGGCELVLACDYRLASDDKSTQIGLPETKLGIIPGFGGCVRLPRVIGLQAALDIILAGKSVDSKKAYKLGLVDSVVPSNLLEAEAIKFAKEVAGKGKRRKTFSAKGAANVVLESFVGRPIVFSQARKGVMKMTKGQYPAVLKAIDVVKNTYGMSNRDKALKIEAEGFSEVAITDVSKNLIRIFFMTEAIKKQNGVDNPSVKGREISHMGVLGAGTMGGGIAQLGADKGIEVRVKDLSPDALSKAFIAAQKIWQKKMEQRRMDKYEFKKKMDLISGGLDYAGFKRLDLVVEAIVEDMNIKKKVIGETAGQMRDDAIIATNTSSLSVTEMAKGHPRPENFVGMHFFNPVHKMPLVEVIRGEKTSDEVTATIFELSKRMGKIPVVVRDGPGFIVNRLLLPYLNEAVYLFEEGYSVEDIDKAFVKFGMPMGPLRLLDEIGIDVAVKVAKIFHQAFGERAEPCKIMYKMSDNKDRFGVKSGKGFYTYDEKGRQQAVDTSIYAACGLGQPTKKVTNHDELVHRGIFAMINEAMIALEEKIVDTHDQVDLGMIMGTGFPPFRGGLMKYAETVGYAKIADDLEVFSTRYGKRHKPSSALIKAAK